MIKRNKMSFCSKDSLNKFKERCVKATLGGRWVAVYGLRSRRRLKSPSVVPSGSIDRVCTGLEIFCHEVTRSWL